jgi:pimeloyl-ACP methyl ester carboxylesterase
VVGHSVGSMVAVGVAARIAERLPAERRRDVTLVTLGQCIPLLSLLPGAFRFRADLKALADARELPWLDMNARADSLCFAQANPVEVSGVAAAGGGQGVRPLQQVVRPFRMFAPADYARLRRNKLRLHFQYLMASALLNEYDYFRMTAGPDRLHASQSA